MKKILIGTLFLSLIALGIVSFTFAWIEYRNTNNVNLTPGEFDITIQFYLDDELVTEINPHYDETTGLLFLNAYDDMLDNYIGNLKVIISVTAHNTARFRVKIQDEWKLIRTYPFGDPTEVIIASEVRDEDSFVSRFNVHEDFIRREEDTFFYYNGIVGKGETIELIFIDGGSLYPMRVTDTYTERAFITLSLYVDVVQANRIVEVWKVNQDLFE
jgi:hypothetical protein